jgi:rhodanese-related sulfurtransferase
MGLESISPAELHQRMRNDPVTVLDVNSPQSWVAAHVPGALNLDPVGFSESDLPQDRDAFLVFYCSNFLCRKAPNAARRAKSMGYRNICVMSAGISGWVGAALPTESGKSLASSKCIA